MRLTSATCALLLAAMACGGPRPAPRVVEPGSAAGLHLLLVTVDTLRADHLGCYGHRPARTPRIDALAAAGLRFDPVTTAAPITLPAHATILTGLDPPAHGVRHNGMFRLAPERVTLAERLAARGFRTAAFVGAYVLDHRYGLDQGFEHYDDAVNAQGVLMEGGRFHERRADEVTSAALAWLDETRSDSAPRFLWVHYFDPHGPYEPPPPYAALDPYDGEIAFVDAELGRLLDGMDARGMLSRTLVVLTADHGEGLGEHDEPTHADLLYDSTLRVPLVIAGPPVRRPAAVLDRIAGTVDIVPTLLALLGMDAGDAPLDGRSLLEPDADPDRALYVETLSPLLDYGWSPLHGLRRARDKLIVAPKVEYFDLAADPGELHNLYPGPEPAGELRQRLERLRERWPPDAEALASATALDQEQLERLASLGYVGSSAPAAERDPKRMMPLWHRMNLAGRLSLLGDHTRAVAEIQGVLREDPANAKAWYMAATIHEKAGQAAEAEAAFRRAVELRPRADGLVNLARLALARGDRPAFERYLAEAERLDPQEGGVPLGRAYDLAQRGRYDEARVEFERALALDPVRFGPIARRALARLPRAPAPPAG